MPFELGSLLRALAALATGFGFGFVLERGGLADARRLAAQFYLTDVRVLKVMFSAIVVAMLGLYGLAGVGLVDLERVFVNPTNLWPGVLGGLLLGAGFILGGYCPGTSLLAAANLKLDALAFVGGVLAGVFAFGETVGLYEDWYEHAGAYGRQTLPDLTGLGSHLLVPLVVGMALVAFWAGERAEDHLGPPAERGARRGLGRLAPVLLGAALLVALAGPPSARKRLTWAQQDLSALFASGEVQVDPAELLELQHNRQVALHLVDVRGEAAFNLFHLRDAQRWDPASGRELDLPRAALVVVVAQNTAEAEAGWALLRAQGYRNCYALAGGVELWLEVFASAQRGFSRSLGGRWPASRPPADAAGARVFSPRVKVAKPAKLAGGGCG